MNADVTQTVEIESEPTEVWDEIIAGDWLGEDAVIPAEVGSEGQVTESGVTRVLIVEEVDAPQRLTFRWASFEDAPSRVEIELIRLGDRTRVVVTETPLHAVMSASALAGAAANAR